jgi:hypothetical protein
MGAVENVKEVADLIRKFNDIELNRRSLTLEDYWIYHEISGAPKKKLKNSNGCSNSKAKSHSGSDSIGWTAIVRHIVQLVGNPKDRQFTLFRLGFLISEISSDAPQLLRETRHLNEIRLR